MSLYRDGEAFVRRNQKLIAKRTGWPDGALQACWDLEDRFPGWQVSWLGENRISGFERPAGYWATWDEPPHRVEVFRADLGELAERMAEGPPPHDYDLRGCAWCLAHLGARRVKL